MSYIADVRSVNVSTLRHPDVAANHLCTSSSTTARAGSTCCDIIIIPTIGQNWILLKNNSLQHCLPSPYESSGRRCGTYVHRTVARVAIVAFRRHFSFFRSSLNSPSTSWWFLGTERHFQHNLQQQQPAQKTDTHVPGIRVSCGTSVPVTGIYTWHNVLLFVIYIRLGGRFNY